MKVKGVQVSVLPLKVTTFKEFKIKYKHIFGPCLHLAKCCIRLTLCNPAGFDLITILTAGYCRIVLPVLSVCVKEAMSKADKYYIPVFYEKKHNIISSGPHPIT